MKNKMSKRTILEIAALGASAALMYFLVQSEPETKVQENSTVEVSREDKLNSKEYAETILSQTPYESMKGHGSLEKLTIVGKNATGPIEVYSFTPAYDAKTIGSKTPRQLVFNPNTISAEETDNDVRSYAKHKLHEIKDLYTGIIGETYIGPQDIAKEKYKISFLEDLIEMRADHAEIKDMLNDSFTGKESISRSTLGKILNKYTEAKTHLEQQKKTPEEARLFNEQKNILEKEIQCSKDTDGQYKVEFNLSGKSGNYKF